MIKLHQFAPAFGLPNASPFCMKLETYLRMAHLDYEVPKATLGAFRNAPLGKMPYIEDRGVIHADSSLIIQYLERTYHIGLDDWLSPQQRSQALAYQVLMEESIYWCTLHARWTDPQGWKLTEPAFFGSYPWPVRWLLPKLARRGIQRKLREQGTGRHNPKDIIAIGKRAITALATFLGNKNYIMGDVPCTLDASAYAFITNLIWVPYTNELNQHALQFPQFHAYCMRMKNQFYAD